MKYIRHGFVFREVDSYCFFLLCMYKVMTFANVQDEINMYSEGTCRIIIIYVIGLIGGQPLVIVYM